MKQPRYPVLSQPGWRWLLSVIAAVVVSALGLLDARLPPGAVAANELFIDANLGQRRAATQTATVSRSRYVTVQFDRLPGKSDLSAGVGVAAKALTLNLFTDLTLNIDVESVAAGGLNGVVIAGRVRGGGPGAESSALLVTNEQEGVQVLYALIQPEPSTVFEVKYAGEGAHEIRQLDLTRFPGERGDTFTPPALPVLPARDGVQDDTGNTIDVMVVWTAAAEAQAGGSAAIAAKVLAVITDANASYANSAIAQRLRLVHMRKVDYVERSTGNDTNDYSADLSRMFTPNDGFLDELQTLRDNYGADYIQLLRKSGTPPTLCGGSYMNDPMTPAQQAKAFTVSDESCSPATHVFQHELGHSMGIHHNVQSDGSGTPIAHGFCQPAGAPKYRTIMAEFNNQPPSNPCNAFRINQWSNPALVIQGAVSGDGTADAHQALDLNLPITRNFRQSVTIPRADTAGVFRQTNGLIYLKDTNVTGIADNQIVFGIPGDLPIAGDFNSDGIDSIGVYRAGTFFLRNSNSTGFADVQSTFGSPGDLPIIGDWDGNGTDTLGLYRNGLFLLSNSNVSPSVSHQFALGQDGDIPMAGDWDGNNLDSVGVFRPSNGLIFLRNSLTTGVADVQITFGIPNDKPVAGDWDGDGTDTVGVFRDGLFLLRNSNTTGFADVQFALGQPGDVPVAGDWDNLPYP